MKAPRVELCGTFTLGQPGTCRRCYGSGETLSEPYPGTISRERIACPYCKGSGWDPTNVVECVE